MLCTDGVGKYEINSGEQLNLLYNVLFVAVTLIWQEFLLLLSLIFRHVRKEKCKVGGMVKEKIKR
jgi:hypothetical protein